MSIAELRRRIVNELYLNIKYLGYAGHVPGDLAWLVKHIKQAK